MAVDHQPKSKIPFGGRDYLSVVPREKLTPAEREVQLQKLYLANFPTIRALNKTPPTSDSEMSDLLRPRNRASKRKHYHSRPPKP
ncbi:MAG: hypothetical protein WC503_05035 [Candidatus Shapirobacteria bacterium]